MSAYRATPQLCPDYSGKPLGPSQCLSAFFMLAAAAMAAMAIFGYFEQRHALKSLEIDAKLF